MGCLRLYLSLAVLIGHFPNGKHFWAAGGFISGAVALRFFYVISGFYIQLIISRYEDKKHWKGYFYLSRLLRLFPAYYLVLGLTMWFYGTSCNSYCTSMVINGSFLSLAFYYVSNLLIVGQDVGKFLSYHFSTGGFSFDPHLLRPNYWVENMMWVSQAWSIALELAFYGVAPFLLRLRTRELAVVAGCSLAIKYALLLNGFGNVNNWYNGFFPSELHTFLLGALAARRVFNPSSGNRFQRQFLIAGCALATIWLIAKNALSYDFDELLILSGACLLPFVFALTRQSRIDRWIGDLSYPVYLNHLLIMAFLATYIADPSARLIGSVATSIVFSGLTVLVIERPMTRFRHKHFRSKPDDEAGGSEEQRGRAAPVAKLFLRV